MKHLTRKFLAVVLALATMSAMLTTALAANTDKLTLAAYPEGGYAAVNTGEATTFSVFPYITNAAGVSVVSEYNVNFLWTLNEEIVSVNTSYYDLPANKTLAANSVLMCSVSAMHKTDGTYKSADVTWRLSTGSLSDIKLTISQSQSSFNFTSTDTQSGSSVYKEIRTALSVSANTDLSQYQVSFVPVFNSVATFEGAIISKLTELNKVYLTIVGSGLWTTQYTVMLNGKEVLTGILTIEVEKDLSVDAIYNAKPGENVVIPAEDLADLCSKANGTIESFDSITITGCSGVTGVLCYEHTATEKSHTYVFGTAMYAKPSSAIYKEIGDLTFVPTKFANKYSEGTVTITYVADGMDKNFKPVSVSGTIAIIYSKNVAKDISYNCTGAYVMLGGDDFDAVYRAATGTTVTNPVYTVRFLDVPKYGTLYRGYGEGSYGAMGSTALTKSNIGFLTFSSTSTAENSLDKLAYVPTTYHAAGDTVRYLVYSDNKILYVGTINFTSKELVITYTTNSVPLKFSSKDFFTSGSPLLNAQFLVFGNPSSGTLYKDYAGGVKVQTYDYFSHSTAYGVNLLDNVTYVPKEGFTGVVEIPFNGSALSGGVVTGKVRIYVVKDVFEDVDSNNWAAPYINRLYATNIISGTSATTFSPNANMTYGAALKMILLAAGCPKQSETGGTHWASNYLKYAYNNGYVASNSIDLNAAVDRNTIAQLAAKVLGLGMATSINGGIVGPVDSTNGYVYALYNAGILNGSFVNGSNYFYGDKYITRAEVAKIICMINDYVQ